MNIVCIKATEEGFYRRTAFRCQYVLYVLPGSGSKKEKYLLAKHKWDLPLNWLQHNTLLLRFLGPRDCT